MTAKVEVYEHSQHYFLYRNWHASPEAILPPDALPNGFVVYLQDTPVAIGFIILFANCQGAMIDYVITNPDIENATWKKVAMTHLTAACEAFAHVNGKPVLRAFTPHETMAKVARDKLGWWKDGDTYHHIFKPLLIT